VVERYISGQKGYEKTDTVPVIDEEKEKLRAHKTWYTSLYNKLFGGEHQTITTINGWTHQKSSQQQLKTLF
jgi:hemoglobin-like flavoprotein